MSSHDQYVPPMTWRFKSWRVLNSLFSPTFLCYETQLSVLITSQYITAYYSMFNRTAPFLDQKKPITLLRNEKMSIHDLLITLKSLNINMVLLILKLCGVSLVIINQLFTFYGHISNTVDSGEDQDEEK